MIRVCRYVCLAIPCTRAGSSGNGCTYSFVPPYWQKENKISLFFSLFLLFLITCDERAQSPIPPDFVFWFHNENLLNFQSSDVVSRILQSLAQEESKSQLVMLA